MNRGAKTVWILLDKRKEKSYVRTYLNQVFSSLYLVPNISKSTQPDNYFQQNPAFTSYIHYITFLYSGEAQMDLLHWIGQKELMDLFQSARPPSAAFC